MSAIIPAKEFNEFTGIITRRPDHLHEHSTFGDAVFHHLFVKTKNYAEFNLAKPQRYFFGGGPEGFMHFTRDCDLEDIKYLLRQCTGPNVSEAERHTLKAQGWKFEELHKAHAALIALAP